MNTPTRTSSSFVTSTFGFVGLLLILCTTESSGIYFTQRTFQYCLPTDAAVGWLAGRLFAFSSADDTCRGEPIKYDVAAHYADKLSINDTGWIKLDAPIILTTDSKPLTIPIEASCRNGKDKESVHTTLTLTRPNVANETPSGIGTRLSDQQVENACFQGMPTEIFVEENIENIPLIQFPNCSFATSVNASYSIQRGHGSDSIEHTFSIQNNLLVLNSPLDRESLFELTSHKEENITGFLTLEISCELTSSGTTHYSKTASLIVRVLDVNDNPPFFNNDRSQYIVKEVDLSSPDTIEDIDEVIVDKDTVTHNSNNITVSDPKSVCVPRIRCYDANKGKNICHFHIPMAGVADKITEPPYQCIISYRDLSFIMRPTTAFNDSATMVINFRNKRGIVGQNNSPTLSVLRITRNSTLFTRLVQLHNIPIEIKYKLNNQIFNITQTLGIIYVKNVTALEQAPDNVHLDLVTLSGINKRVSVRIVGTKRVDKHDCEWGCSTLNPDEDECNRLCGLGVGAGRCVVRDGDGSKMSERYTTCTHDVSSCPDGTCDELENLYPDLCLQDCTTSVIGQAHIDKRKSPPRGIAMAMGSCWCYEDSSCTCNPPFPPGFRGKASAPGASGTVEPHFKAGTLEKKTPASTALTSPTTTSTQHHGYDLVTSSRLNAAAAKPNDVTLDVRPTDLTSGDLVKVKAGDTVFNDSEQIVNSTVQRQVEAISSTSTAPCDVLCRTAIGICLGAFIAISFSLFMLWFTKRKGPGRKGSMKHVGSVVSMSAVPSDYVEDRDRRQSYPTYPSYPIYPPSPQWSPKGPIPTSQITRPDNGRWEIPREHLRLDKTLGEGEFGLVVKARVFGIDGDESEKTVAVKMLKHCSSQLEEQDLWSEFNLLKDVSHPNVIRLLGACMGDGPFYVIVEYCEHGCLMKYLRRSRLEESGYINHRAHYRYKAPNMSDETRPELEGDLLTMRDLLSFAWQIAKGMSYLSSIKLVHRDLAARNVLVSDGRLLKISDFGLTRDVYETDTYLKKSRGRIPVKWLAPESLYAQIYTTRSDVWSYGIVLWEIVTLGAPPYPGIPPERLYNLLIGGYRMDRPENCPDEMYAVMQKCWKTDAADRPTFKCLAEIFDRILQEKTGYLDLSSGVSEGHENDLYSRCFNSGDQGRHREEQVQSQLIPRGEREDREEEGEDTREMRITTVCNDAYLTPTPSRFIDREKNTPLIERFIEGPNRHVMKGCGQHGEGHTKMNNSLFGKKAVIYPSEQMSLLLENGTARFMNAYDVKEERETRDSESMRIELE